MAESAESGPLYDVFLSYSHAVDRALAPEVQRCLQRLARPWYQPRALRVFRDQDSLPANAHLSATLLAAMRRSRYFVLLASPEAAAARWVRKEVTYWRTHRTRETFLVALTKGTIAWDDANGDFDWKRTTALPSVLRGWFDAEPLWVDLRWARHTPGSMRDDQFRDVVATLAARIHGIDKDELDSADLRQHRLARRLRRAAVGGLALLAGTALVLGLFAVQQARQAQASFERAVSRELAIRSQTLGDAAPTVSALLSVAAWRLDPTDDARAAMIAAFGRPGIAVLPGAGRLVAFDPHGTVLATTHRTGGIQLWDVASRTPRGGALTGHSGPVTAMTFNPAGTVLATASEGEVRVWDVGEHTRIGALPGRFDAIVRAMAFSADGTVLAVGDADGTVQFWDVANRSRIGDPLVDPLSGIDGTILAMAFSPDGAIFGAAGSKGTIQLWDTKTATRIGGSLTHDANPAFSVAFSPDGTMLATGSSDGTAQLWDLARRAPLGEAFTSHNDAVRSVAFSPDGTVLATGSWDNSVQLWDVATRTRIAMPFTGHNGEILSVAFSPDGTTLATGGTDNTARLWDITPQQVSPPLVDHDDRFYSVSFAPSRKLLATGSDEGVRLWDLAAREPTGEPLTSHSLLASVAFSPRVPASTGPVLATSGDGKVQLWDAANRSPIGEPFAEGRNTNRSMAFSPDGKTIAVEDDERTLRFWDTVTHRPIGEPLRSDGGFKAMAFSPDGRLLATGGNDNTVRFWDASTHRPIGEPLTVHTYTVNSVAFSGDSRTLATSSNDGTVRLWDIPSRSQRGAPLVGHTGVVQSVAFGPDGHTLATGGNDGTVRLWNVPSTARLDVALCARAARSLTPEEWARHLAPLPYRQVCP